MASIPPNQTIYVQNLYEKLPKQGENHQGQHSSRPPGRWGCSCRCSLAVTDSRPGFCPSALFNALVSNVVHVELLVQLRQPDTLSGLCCAASPWFLHCASCTLLPLPPFPCRAAQGAARHVLPVWEDHRRGGPEDAAHAGPGLGGVCRRCSSNQCQEHYAELPLLRQTHRELAEQQLLGGASVGTRERHTMVVACFSRSLCQDQQHSGTSRCRHACCICAEPACPASIPTLRQLPAYLVPACLLTLPGHLVTLTWLLPPVLCCLLAAH